MKIQKASTTFRNHPDVVGKYYLYSESLIVSQTLCKSFVVADWEIFEKQDVLGSEISSSENE